MVQEVHVGQPPVPMDGTSRPKLHFRQGPGDSAPAGLFIHMPIQVGRLRLRIGLHHLGRLHICHQYANANVRACTELSYWFPQIPQVGNHEEITTTASNILQGRARRSPWHAPYARRPPPQAADHADGDEEAPGAAPGTSGAAQQGSIPAGLAPLAPLWAPPGTGSPHPMAPAHPGALAAPADPAVMPMRDG